MEKQGRPADMSDMEWLVALEEIRQLKARRDRYADAHDWDGYQSLHAPDHTSFHASLNGDDAPVVWTTSEEMVRNVKHVMTHINPYTTHHSYDPEIIFDTKTKARAIWARVDGGVTHDADGKPVWSIIYGYYYETCEKRDGRWVFTTRRWQNYLAMGSNGPSFPTAPLLGSDAFTSTEKDFGQVRK